MVGGEPCRRDEATAAVRTGLVVISPPLADNLAGLYQRSEPVLVDALVAAGKPRAVVGSHCPRISPEAGGPIQHAHGIGAADAVVHGDVDALVGEVVGDGQALQAAAVGQRVTDRSEEHTSEPQSLMSISYAVFCLKKTTTTTHLDYIK